jgi:hypothetical protein
MRTQFIATVRLQPAGFAGASGWVLAATAKVAIKIMAAVFQQRRSVGSINCCMAFSVRTDERTRVFDEPLHRIALATKKYNAT